MSLRSGENFTYGLGFVLSFFPNLHTPGSTCYRPHNSHTPWKRVFKKKLFCSLKHMVIYFIHHINELIFLPLNSYTSIESWFTQVSKPYFFLWLILSLTYCWAECRGMDERTQDINYSLEQFIKVLEK